MYCPRSIVSMHAWYTQITNVGARHLYNEYNTRVTISVTHRQTLVLTSLIRT